MARFLTPEWLDELGLAMEQAIPDPAASPCGDGESLSFRQVVIGGPDGDTSFVIRMDGRTATLDRCPDREVDVEVRQDLATAVEIATGKLSPSAAFASGRIKLTGRVGLLVEHQEALAALGDPFTALRSTTSY